MNLLMLTLDFKLPGCHSLKEKRGRIRKLKEKFGSHPNIAVSETAYHDNLTLSRWSFVIIGDNKRLLDAESAKIEEYCSAYIDGYLVNSQREYLR